MATLTIRNVPDSTKRALMVRAKNHARSTEAEVRAILEESVKPKAGEKGLGTALQELGEKYGPLDIEFPRDKSPARYVKFE
jgi:antitoxin FitA